MCGIWWRLHYSKCHGWPTCNIGFAVVEHKLYVYTTYTDGLEHKPALLMMLCSNEIIRRMSMDACVITKQQCIRMMWRPPNGIQSTSISTLRIVLMDICGTGYVRIILWYIQFNVLFNLKKGSEYLFREWSNSRNICIENVVWRLWRQQSCDASLFDFSKSHHFSKLNNTL